MSDPIIEWFNLQEHIEAKNKAFDDWNEEKKEIHNFWKLNYVKVSQIRICKVWMNVWNEISKWYDWLFKRPVLVVSTFIWWDLVWVIPFSTKPPKSEILAQFTLPFDSWSDYGLNKPTNLLINQFKLMSIKRLDRLINDIQIVDEKEETKYIPLVEKKLVDIILDEFITKIFKRTKN